MKKITLFLLLIFCTLAHSQIVTNGDFQTGTAAPWYGNAANVVDLGGLNWVNQAQVTSVGNPYDVNLSQVVTLTSGLTYELKFDAFTDATTGTRTMVVGLGQDNAPYAALTATPVLTATAQTFTYQFTINYGDAVNDRVIFDMGAALGFVFIDNVSVTQIVNTCANGIQDGTETGIDCGGSCAPCISPPTVNSPVPPARAASDVVSIYSDAYTSISPINLDAGWCGANAVQATTAGGPANNVLAYKGNACQGITFPSATQNVSGFTNIHVDFFIATGTNLIGKVFNLKIVPNTGGGPAEVEIPIDINGLSPVPVPGTWYSFDRAFSPSQLSNLVSNPIMHEFGVTSNLNNVIWYDNLYIWRAPLSTNEFAANAIKLYPNPASNVVTIESVSVIEKVSVYNLLGQEVISQSPNAELITLDVASLQVGLYVVKTSINGNVSSTRFIKE
ncbi:T9SS type A sorting domain-containing protein [Flavobacterium sp. AS60]|uniref:T9SS type A sorting domain-containing protein n=1 Tax=Flavobacterium anseongense TaxID=2910677 RepID=UPI001F15A10B|nr:T9SS type A sorting domain-containing protein [Flavobacterium sp. AS60]MCF6130081.1 T9SS type A sorting domain-containing protein [Flavobacterium sp. AS60]